MTDLYEILGVARDATREQILAAYRAAVKTSHPDMEGGSREAFERVQAAWDVLGDAEARARYDATGEMPSGAANAIDPLRHDVIIVIQRLLDVVLAEVEDDVDDAPIVRLMKDEAKRTLNLNQSREPSLQHETKRLNRVLKNLKAKTQDDLIGGHIRGKIQKIEAEMVVVKKAVDVIKAVIVELENYEYETAHPDPGRPPRSQTFFIHDLGRIKWSGI